MSIVDFDELPDTSRLWIYAADRPLTSGEVQQLQEGMQHFLTEWSAHKRELRTGWCLRYDQFIMIGVDENTIAASGCSIDSMVRKLQAFEKELDCSIVGTSMHVFYRGENDEIKWSSRPEFKKMLATGAVDKTTVVFNNVIQTLAEFRNGGWEIPLLHSWHADALTVRA